MLFKYVLVYVFMYTQTYSSTSMYTNNTTPQTTHLEFLDGIGWGTSRLTRAFMRICGTLHTHERLLVLILTVCMRYSSRLIIIIAEHVEPTRAGGSRRTFLSQIPRRHLGRTLGLGQQVPRNSIARGEGNADE